MIETGRAPNRGTRILYFAAKFTGQTAQNVLLAGLFLAAGTSTSAAMDLSSVFVAILIPALVFGAVGGAFADRIGPWRAYPIGAALRLAVAVGALFVLPSFGLVWLAAFAYSAVSQVFTPAELALVRRLQAGRSGGAHSWMQAIQYAGQGAGMIVLAPVLYWLGGLTAILAGAAAGMAVLLAITFVVGLRLRGHDPLVATGDRERSAGIRPAIRFFLNEHTAAYAVALQSFKTIVSRAVFVAMPLYLTHEIGIDGGMLLFLVAPGIAGVVLALLWSGRSMSVDQASYVMRWSMLGLVVSVFALAALDYGISAMARYSQVPPVVEFEASLNTTFAVALPVAFLLGIVLTTSVIAGRVVLTELAPRDQQARVFAVQEVVSEALVVAPLLLTGIGITYAGARPVLGVIGVVGAVLFVALELLRPRPILEPANADVIAHPQELALLEINREAIL